MIRVHTLNPDSIQRKKIFYLPAILVEDKTSGVTQNTFKFLEYFSEQKWIPGAYASRVMPGQTLLEAIVKDLRDDFGYHGQFEVESSSYFDTIPDNKGVLTERYLVQIVLLGSFNVGRAKPLGMRTRLVVIPSSMDNIPVSSLGVQFGKYLDSAIDTKLTLEAHETLEDPQLSSTVGGFYLFRHADDKMYYCCYVPIDPSDSGPKSTPGIMRSWLENTLGLENVSLELLTPNSHDWFQDFYLAEVRFTDPSSKYVH